ncbi:uncharacterized protein A4U43_C04F21160 [Asparagus officinalis]|uniref:Fatty acyl-CoA reductase n=1 Tax=Asparagus officinalis TaxID=4686 RepID=A0A5P1F2L6_ASPOF|nr:fatty acyl-CoA reductase 2-like [Asparagus officinalis]ONK72606.1 uncharacterized protein A4U43_C04F21160 [Asparagus officinalis]
MMINSRLIQEPKTTFSFNDSLPLLTKMMMKKKKKDTISFLYRNDGTLRSKGRSATKVDGSGRTRLAPSKVTNPSCTSTDLDEGIGIIRFLKGKHLFITGATGFFAKVLIEKILRTVPEVGKIHLLIKAKDTDAATNRLKTEILDAELFRSLQEIHGKNYEDFMLRKLIPVVGNIKEAQMGIQGTLANEISEGVDVIVNSAANTTFDERYDAALDINTMGPFRVMSFSKTCKRLKLFLHVSTAYVNGRRRGRALEKPFCIGDTIAREAVSTDVSMPYLDIETEMKLAFASAGRVTSDASLIKEMKDLGLARAKLHGWQDTYAFTKAMGEMILNSMRGDTPVVIVRPGVIESTFKEPFSGWIEGSRMMDPLVLYYGKGKLAGFVADPNGVLDVVPADMVVNATLAAMAKHGQSIDAGIHTYHVVSSCSNPLFFKDLARSIYEHFDASPCSDSKGRPIITQSMKLFTDVDKFSTYILSDIVQKGEKLPQRMKNMLTKYAEQFNYLATLYAPYTLYGGRFDDTNTQKLMQEMSKEEMQSFDFDVGGISWADFIANVHIPGLRRYVLKEIGINVSDTEKIIV